MATPQAALRIGSCRVLLLGTIPGFGPDGNRVRSAFAGHDPDLVALGVPPDDLPSLELLWKGDKAKAELVEPDLANEGFLKLLARFGETRIPSPDLEAAYAMVKEEGIPVEALDLDDETYTAEYVKRVKVRHLWWAPRRETRVLKSGFERVHDPHELAIAWDTAVNDSKPLREVEALRESQMAKRIRELAGKSQRLLAVVPVARLKGITRLLEK